MKKLRFVHCADVHLDAPFTSLGSDSDKSSRRRQDLKLVFERIIDIVKEVKADIVIISGDLYEHNYVRKSTINYINDKFCEVPDAKIFLIPGNHDPMVANSFYRNFAWRENVCILGKDNASVVLEELGASIHGLGFKGFYEEAATVNELRLTHPDFINILLAHGTVDFDISKDRNSYNPLSSKDLAGLNMDYIALGHFHNRIEDLGGHGLIYNPGSPEPLGFDETGAHGIYIGCITRSDDGRKQLEIEFLSTGRKHYESVEVCVTGCNTDEQVISRVQEALGKYSHLGLDSGLFNITLKGYLENGFKLNAQQVQSYFKDKVFYLKLNDETAVDYNFDEIRNEPGLRGLYVRKLLDRIDKAADDSQKRLLLKALYFGMEALEQGKVEIN